MKRKSVIITILGLFVFVQTAQAEWTSPKRLTWTSGWSWAPSIAVDSADAIHAVWADNSSGNYEVFYRKSTDGGAHWSHAKRLTWNTGESAYPTIAVDSSDAVHVVWKDDAPNNEIFYRKSTDGGLNWSHAKRLTWNSGQSSYPNVIVDSLGAIHIVWQDNTPGNDEVYYRRSEDAGANWTPVQRLTWTSGSSWRPEISADSVQTLHVVWDDDTPAQYECEIYCKKSPDGGKTWGSTKRLTWTPGTSDCPDVAVDTSDMVHIVWRNYAQGQANLYYKQTTDSGATWSMNRKLNWTGIPYGPCLGLDSAKSIHVVWQDHSPGQYDLYYMKSVDGGTNWSAAKRLTWTSGDSYYPIMAIDSNDMIHLIWQDNTPGNFQVYYKKGN